MYYCFLKKEKKKKKLYLAYTIVKTKKKNSQIMGILTLNRDLLHLKEKAL